MKIGAGLSQEHARRCANVLGVSVPTDLSNLKQVFRQLARETHPDRGGDATKFREVREAYDFLIANAEYLTADVRVAGRTTQGDLLADLGNGLGPRVNGKPCHYCSGRGYQVSSWREHTDYVTCRTCEGTGEVEMFNPVLPKWRLARTKQGSKPREKKAHVARTWTPPEWMTR